MAMLSSRASSMLPSIKCSNCGDDIEISKMGDHLCRPPTRDQAPKITTQPVQQDDRQQAASRVKSSYFFSPAQLSTANNKQTKAAPPRIDPSAANRPYARRDVYASNGPNSAQTQQETRPQRQQRHPSDDLASNLDCAFPAFPTTPAVKTPNSAVASPMFFQGLREVRPAPPPPATQKAATLAPPPLQLRQPQSPGMAPPEMDLNSPNFFAGLKAMLPGQQKPQQQQQQQPQQEQRPVSPMSRQERDEAKRDEFFARKPSSASSRLRNSKGSLGQNQYNSYGTRELVPGAKPTSAGKAEATPYRPSRPGGEVDKFIASLKEDDGKHKRANNGGPLRGLERSPSEPWQQQANSAQQGRPVERSATTNDLQSNSYSTFATAGAQQQQQQQQRYQREEVPDSDDQLLPALTYGQTNYDRQYSSHSNSSSTSSAVSRESAFTSGLSTPPSDVSLATSFAGPSPPKAKGNAYLSQYNPYNPYSLDDAPPMPQKVYTTTSPTEASDVSIYPPRSTTSSSQRPNPFSTRGERDAGPDRPTLTRSATETSNTSLKPRHSCRGCKQPIVGKSVKASDGRLTGRYHRPCFVCTTCRAPFSTAQVYVLNDAPYCEHHYHALNGSLCAACNTGIEGQYRETDKREKLHPRCLTCRTCRCVLADEYFEVNNTVYCERHAMAEVRRLAQPGMGYGGGAAGLAPPSLKAERRMTRLGMM